MAVRPHQLIAAQELFPQQVHGRAQLTGVHLPLQEVREVPTVALVVLIAALEVRAVYLAAQEVQEAYREAQVVPAGRQEEVVPQDPARVQAQEAGDDSFLIIDKQT